MTQKIKHFIDGKLIIDNSPLKNCSKIHNPATGKVLTYVPEASEKIMAQVIQSSQKAFVSWGQVPVVKRARILFRLKELLQKKENYQKMLNLIVLENGKTISDAQGEIERGIEVIEFACGLPHLLKGEILKDVGENIDGMSLRVPLGVVLGLTPFNFPIMVPLWMVPLAVGCGNTFILKPSEKVPSAGLFLAELFSKAGLPSGVFNVVHGGSKTASQLIQNQAICAISFVGSSKAARDVYHKAQKNPPLKPARVQALGGAKNHMLIMPDAPLEEALKCTLSSAFGAAGQRCMANSVLVLVGAIADTFIEKLVEKLPELIVGSGTDPKTQIGPVISSEQLRKICAYLDEGIKEKAVLKYDGRTHPLAKKTPKQGFYLGPSLFDHVKPDMKIYQDEIFGPVLCVVRVKTYEEAFELIEKCPYGNGASIFTQNAMLARHFKQNISIGMVGVNIPIPVPLPFFSFGGDKHSLYGDQHIYGMEGIRFYTKYRVICEKWNFTQLKDLPSFSMPVLN